MRDETLLACIAVICVTVLESVAMLEGVDGDTFKLAIYAILSIAGAAGGYVIATKAPK